MNDTKNESSFKHNVVLRIPFRSSREAEIACKVLSVDKELNPLQTRKTLNFEDSTLIVIYEADSIKRLRTVVSSFFDSVVLVAHSFEMFA